MALNSALARSFDVPFATSGEFVADRVLIIELPNIYGVSVDRVLAFFKGLARKMRA